MATIGGKQVSDVAAARRANIKKTGGLPAVAPVRPKGSDLGNDAKQIKIRQNVENDPEVGFKRGGY